jgi:hypothetical protein
LSDPATEEALNLRGPAADANGPLTPWAPGDLLSSIADAFAGQCRLSLIGLKPLLACAGRRAVVAASGHVSL